MVLAVSTPIAFPCLPRLALARCGARFGAERSSRRGVQGDLRPVPVLRRRKVTTDWTDGGAAGGRTPSTALRRRRCHGKTTATTGDARRRRTEIERALSYSRKESDCLLDCFYVESGHFYFVASLISACSAHVLRHANSIMNEYLKNTYRLRLSRVFRKPSQRD